MKKKLAFGIILVCVVTLFEAIFGHGLNFAYPYGKVPSAWMLRAPWSTSITWLVAVVGSFLLLLDHWNNTHT